MNQIPQTLGGEVTADINALISESDRLRDWNAPEIQVLLRRIEKLQKVDARDAFVRFGALAAICGNVDALFEYYRKALLLPGEAETKHEIWVSMGNAGLYSQAQEIGTWLLDPKRGFFPKIWEEAVSIGQVLAVWNRLQEAKRTYPDLSDVDFSLLERAAAVMRERKLTDENIGSILNLMGDIQRAHRIMFSGTLASILKVLRPPDDPPYLYFAMPLDASVGEIHAMNRELARLVVEKLPEGAFPQGMVASFAKAPPVELRAAA
ncbi:MAG TPA: hypothetical protein VN929_17115 [Burkholderiales bacterium]|nr:hypothetical protein [Burkholderiales bacterium]